MCLATVYKESDNTVILKNTSRIDVDGGKYHGTGDRGRRKDSHGGSGKQYREDQL